MCWSACSFVRLVYSGVGLEINLSYTGFMQTSTSKHRINEALYAIHKDIAKAWAASELAGIAAYSVFHFQRLFKQVTGENLNDYVRRVRLEAAANTLFAIITLATILNMVCGKYMNIKRS